MYREFYYTPRIVLYWLERYPALAAAVQWGTGLAEGDVGPKSGDGPLYQAPRRPGVDPRIDPRYYRPPGRTGRMHDLLSTAMAVKVDLDRGIRSLPDRERQVIVWRYCEQWTVREVAAKMGVSYGRIQQISTRGVHRIARKLGYTR